MAWHHLEYWVEEQFIDQVIETEIQRRLNVKAGKKWSCLTFFRTLSIHWRCQFVLTCSIKIWPSPSIKLRGQDLSSLILLPNTYINATIFFTRSVHLFNKLFCEASQLNFTFEKKFMHGRNLGLRQGHFYSAGRG